MKRISERIRASLRMRLAIGMAVMLLPLILLGIGTFGTSRVMIAALEEAVRTETEEMRPVVDLQILILQAGMPPNDYLITGDRSERALFDYLIREIDEGFAKMAASAAFEGENKRKYVEAATAEWSKARLMGAEILTVPHPVRSAGAVSRMKVFDAHVGRAADILNLLYDEVRHEINELQVRARTVQRHETLLLFGMFAAALITAAATGYLLFRSIILPIRALQDGVFRFGQGDNSFRVVLDRRDEFGQLAKTLNDMAERLEYDGLTGVYNRQEFHRRLKNELDRSLRYGHVVTLLMVDLDHFKRVNDTCGHPCGDEALRTVATRLLGDVRNFDSVARYGGEEFVIIMPETSVNGARAVAERLRESVAARPVTTTRGNVLNITISIGMAAFPDDARSEDDLIAAADLALYAAKERGRNLVVMYEPGLDPARRNRPS